MGHDAGWKSYFPVHHPDLTCLFVHQYHNAVIKAIVRLASIILEKSLTVDADALQWSSHPLVASDPFVLLYELMTIYYSVPILFDLGMFDEIGEIDVFCECRAADQHQN